MQIFFMESLIRESEEEEEQNEDSKSQAESVGRPRLFSGVSSDSMHLWNGRNGSSKSDRFFQKKYTTLFLISF